MITQEKIEKLMAELTPEQQHLAKAMTLTRIENETMRAQLATLKSDYDELWKVMIVILHAQPGKELRIHQSQFLRFKEEYRIDRRQDDEEVVVKLLTVHDEWPARIDE